MAYRLIFSNLFLNSLRCLEQPNTEKEKAYEIFQNSWDAASFIVESEKFVKYLLGFSFCLSAFSLFFTLYGFMHLIYENPDMSWAGIRPNSMPSAYTVTATRCLCYTTEPVSGEGES